MLCISENGQDLPVSIQPPIKFSDLTELYLCSFTRQDSQTSPFYLFQGALSSIVDCFALPGQHMKKF